MTDKLLCPFCGQELKELYCSGISVGFRCKNKNCPETNIMCGTKMLWQALIDTKKKLDIAVDKLKDIKAYYDDSYTDPNYVNWHIVAQRLANDADDALEQINQKEE